MTNFKPLSGFFKLYPFNWRSYMQIKQIILFFLVLFIAASVNAADWRYGVVRGSDNKQVDIDYQSIRQEEGFIVFEVRMPPEKKLTNLFSSKKYERYIYGVECTVNKAKWLYAGDEDANGTVEVKFHRSLNDSPSEDIPSGTMLAGIQSKLCKEFNLPPKNFAKEDTSLKPEPAPPLSNQSTLAPNGIVTDEWIPITENKGVKYYAKKQSLERQGNNVIFITGRDLGADIKSVNNRKYRYDAEISTIDCRNGTYSSGDSELFDSSGIFVERVKASLADKTPHPINGEVGTVYKNLMCQFEDKSNSSAQTNDNQQVKNESSFATGTSWQISKKHLVTAYHVVQGATAISVMINDDDIRLASLVTYDEKNDLAIIKIDGNPLKTNPINLATSPVKIGSDVAVLGFPLPELLGTKLQANTGEVSAIHGLHNDPRFYRITANVQGGNSGGPVLNQRGEVIGVVSSKLSDLETLKNKGELPQNVNFAIKNHYLKSLLESANITAPKIQRKLKPIEEVIEEMKDSVFLLITETKN